MHEYSKAQALLRGVVAPCYGVDNKMPKLHATKFVPLD